MKWRTAGSAVIGVAVLVLAYYAGVWADIGTRGVVGIILYFVCCSAAGLVAAKWAAYWTVTGHLFPPRKGGGS